MSQFQFIAQTNEVGAFLCNQDKIEVATFQLRFTQSGAKPATKKDHYKGQLLGSQIEAAHKIQISL
jgi:hypothetical protein